MNDDDLADLIRRTYLDTKCVAWHLIPDGFQEPWRRAAREARAAILAEQDSALSEPARLMRQTRAGQA